MNANELRIGNLIQIKLGEIEIAKVEELTLQTENNNQYYILKTNLLSNNSDWVDPIDSFEPIPITDEWLLKFGFVKQKNYYKKSTGISSYSWFRRGSHFFTIEKYDYIDYGETWHPTLNFDNIINVIQYVHQLQNIYFALRCEELTIKQ